MVNLDPVDQTVLANEQVEDGRGWRCGALVEIARDPDGRWDHRYADPLLGTARGAPDWPDRVVAMQANWIGKSHGVPIALRSRGCGRAGITEKALLRVFTTRADTIMGVTYVAVAPTIRLTSARPSGNAGCAFVESASAARHGSAMARPPRR